MKKRKLFVAMSTIAFAAMLISAGTFALFTSEASNEGNKFIAGTVELTDITNNGEGTAVFNVQNIAPGDEGFGLIRVRNTGSLDAWVRIGGIEGSGDLFGGEFPLRLEAANPDGVYYIPSGGETNFKIDWNMPLEAGNEYQGKSGTATITVQAVQAKHNGDVNNRDDIVWP